MDSEGRRVFAIPLHYSCKGNVGKDSPILAAVLQGQAGPQVREWMGQVILASTGRARRKNEEILVWIV